MTESEYQGPTPAEKLREANSKRFINFFSKGNFSEANFGQIKEKLDSVVLRPIELISSMIDGNENISISDIESITFKPLRDLAKQIYLKKEKGENSNEEIEAKNQSLSSELNELKKSNEKANSILESLLDNLFLQSKSSPNAKVQGLSGAIKSTDITEQPKLLEMIISTLNLDIQKRMSNESSHQKNVKNQERLIAQLKNSNAQLQSDIELVKKRYEEKLSEAKDDYERQLQVITIKNEQVEGINNLREELQSAKKEMMNTIIQYSPKSPKTNPLLKENTNESAEHEMNEKLDTMLAKLNESSRKNELFEECLRELQNALSLIDGEGINTSPDFAERTKTIVRRLNNIEKASVINDSDIQKIYSEITNDSANSSDKVQFYENKLKEMIEMSEKCIRQKDRAEEKVVKLREQIETLTSQKEKVLEIINQVEKNVLEIENMLNINISDDDNELAKRIVRIKDEVGTHLNKSE